MQRLMRCCLLTQACSSTCKHTQLRPADTPGNAHAIFVALKPAAYACKALVQRVENALLCQANLTPASCYYGRCVTLLVFVRLKVAYISMHQMSHLKYLVESACQVLFVLLSAMSFEDSCHMSICLDAISHWQLVWHGDVCNDYVRPRVDISAPLPSIPLPLNDPES